MGEDEAASRPDVVLIMTDQQRHDQVGYASGGHFETPTLDALAARGVIFETAYSASTTCVPARASLLTGILPHRLPTQENGLALREGTWTIAREMSRAGYETALIGKMHFAPVHSDHGFDTMRLCEHIGYQALGPLSRARHDTVDDYHDWLRKHGLDDWRLQSDGPMPRHYPPEAHPTAWVERETTEFLAQRASSRPLFLVISFPHPHAPYDPPEPYASMFGPADSILPATSYRANEALPLVFQLATSASTTRPEAADPARVRAFLATVRGLVKQVDDAVEQILTHLDLEHTIVFFTSDHGDFSGHRGLMRKNPWIPFDDLARVPFFVSGGRVSAERRVRAPVQSFDFALTCLDYAGIDPPANMTFDSRSLRTFVDEAHAEEDDDRAVFCGTGPTGWPMVRRGRYKYLRHHAHPEPEQCVLFDLDADPDECTSVLDHSEHAGIAADLADRLRVATSASTDPDAL